MFTHPVAVRTGSSPGEQCTVPVIALGAFSRASRPRFLAMAMG